YIGIKSSLRKKINGAELRGFLLENFDERMADAAALLFRIFHSLKSGKELFTGIDIAKALTKPLGEQLANPLGLVLPQKPIVDEDADQSFFDRLVNQSRSHGRIDAAAEATKHPAVSDLFADPVDCGFDKVLHSPGRLTTADSKDKVIEDFLAPRRVRHFRMKLNTEEPPAGIGKGSDGGIAAVGKHLPTLGHRRHLVPMAHPHSHQICFGKAAK